MVKDDIMNILVATIAVVLVFGFVDGMAQLLRWVHMRMKGKDE